MRETRLET